MVSKLFLFFREQVIGELILEIHLPPQLFCCHWLTVLLSVNSGCVLLLLIQTHSRVHGRPEAVWGLSVAAWCLRQISSVKQRHFLRDCGKTYHWASLANPYFGFFFNPFLYSEILALLTISNKASMTCVCIYIYFTHKWNLITHNRDEAKCQPLFVFTGSL